MHRHPFWQRIKKTDHLLSTFRLSTNGCQKSLGTFSASPNTFRGSDVVGRSSHLSLLTIQKPLHNGYIPKLKGIKDFREYIDYFQSRTDSLEVFVHFSKFSQNAAKMQSKSSRNALKIQPKCSQNSAKM